MSNSTITTKRHARITIGAFALLLMVLGTACDDFYTDSPPTPDIAQPTPANVVEGNPEVILENAAREALALRLGIDAAAPRKILFEDETWTELNPGCYPAPASLTGAYLVPGYRLIMQHDGVFYEYDADQGAGTGALCESTLQTVPVESAFSTVSSNRSDSPDFDTVHVIRSEEEVTEFNTTHSEMATIEVEVIEFPEEVLVGSWIQSETILVPIRAYRSTDDASSIVIEVSAPEETEEVPVIEATPNGAFQMWVFLDTTESTTSYEFLVVE